MSKLHCYQGASKDADGDGDVSKTDEFSVQITWGKVVKGKVYEIRKGTSPSGDNFNCLAGAETNGTAKFKKVNGGEGARADGDTGAGLRAGRCLDRRGDAPTGPKSPS